MQTRRKRLTCRLAAAACGLTLLGPAASAELIEPLRILPLGDSITWGWGGESSFGYRGPLAELLDLSGIDFEYVGSISDEITIDGRRFIDPPVRELIGSPLHYGIPGANADEVDALGNSLNNKDSLLWSIRNDMDGDELLDASFSAAGGLIPTLVSENLAPDAVLLHVGTNSIGRTNGVPKTVVTPGTDPDRYLGANNNADAQLFRLLTGLGDDLTSQGLLTGSDDDTRIILSRIIPRPVDSRQTAQGPRNTNGIDFDILQNGIDYNNAIDDVVAALDPVLRDAITIVDMFDIDVTDPTLGLVGSRNDGQLDQPFDTFTGNSAVFNEAAQTVGGTPVSEADPLGPDFADWLLRYDEQSETFYDAAVASNDLRWNPNLYGIEVGGEFYDAIHPNTAGYELMARVWFAGLFGTAPGSPGDFSGNGRVEQADLNLVLNNWGTDSAFGLPEGWVFTNGLGGTIDQEELNAVLNNWGASVAPSFEGFDIPEPGLLALAVAGPLVLRRRGDVADRSHSVRRVD
ncbi:MAG: SGNH/GDSL hydrolase family protein [Planctomycetota bacterium]